MGYRQNWSASLYHEHNQGLLLMIAWKLQAALQFEWAWQHPRRSRHLHDSKLGSRRLKALQKSILLVSWIPLSDSDANCVRHSRAVRTLISRPPFNTWPLHVKLFTHEAEQYWKDSATTDTTSPLPPGFTCTLELEGVDGKSGLVGSGRQGPISIDDGKLLLSISSRLTYIFPR
jgi:structure-specific endonuclease subunit SLX1